MHIFVLADCSDLADFVISYTSTNYQELYQELNQRLQSTTENSTAAM